ncbi:atypical CYS HIS rich thioredoxin 4 [Striga asiatica]|uniref:Atypical CYS HIS rich thioredoxin 4 n=1 Tax=Striga asiatica TaxID=4170 RepID=A0A5A7R3G7_STRAF|nr:atypical CYS HIS rich thioredoxin 4 [Striga asiatica]
MFLNLPLAAEGEVRLLLLTSLRRVVGKEKKGPKSIVGGKAAEAAAGDGEAAESSSGNADILFNFRWPIFGSFRSFLKNWTTIPKLRHPFLQHGANREHIGPTYPLLQLLEHPFSPFLVNLVRHHQCGPGRKPLPVELQLHHQLPQLHPRGPAFPPLQPGRQIQHVRHHFRPLYVPQESVPEPAILVGPTNEARDIGHRDGQVVVVHLSQIGPQSGESVMPDHRLGPRQGPEKRAFSGIGHSHKAHDGFGSGLAYVGFVVIGLIVAQVIVVICLGAFCEVHIAQATVTSLGHENSSKFVSEMFVSLSVSSHALYSCGCQSGAGSDCWKLSDEFESSEPGISQGSNDPEGFFSIEEEGITPSKR